MKAMILAAGRGERLRPITDKTPKPLVKVGSETLLARHLRRIRAVGIHDVVINLHHLGEQIESALGDGSSFGMNITYSRESELLDISGGVRNALALLSDPFLLLSADIWSDVPLGEIIAPLPDRYQGRLLLIDPGNAQLYSYVAGEARRMGHLIDYGGVALVRKSVYASLSPGPVAFQTPINPIVDRGAMAAVVYRGNWVNVGTANDLARARELAAAEPR